MNYGKIGRCGKAGRFDEAVHEHHDPGPMKRPRRMLSPGHQQFLAPRSVERPAGGEVVIEIGELACEVSIPSLDLDLRTDRA